MYSQDELWDIQKARKAAIFSNFVESDIIKAQQDDIIKGKSFPIGTVHNGFKKVKDGVWKKVSEHGMTKEEHSEKASEITKERENLPWSSKDQNKRVEAKSRSMQLDKESMKHSENSSKLDDKEYSD